MDENALDVVLSTRSVRFNFTRLAKRMSFGVTRNEADVGSMVCMGLT
jgi:hypothetical protein